MELWDTATAKETLSFKRHADFVACVKFSPDGRRLASAGRDGTVKLWDRRTGKEAFTFKGHTDMVRCLSFSPDGRQLASQR